MLCPMLCRVGRAKRPAFCHDGGQIRHNPGRGIMPQNELCELWRLVGRITCSLALTAEANVPRRFMAVSRQPLACSLIGTAKLNGLDPESYLRNVPTRIANHPINRTPSYSPGISQQSASIVNCPVPLPRQVGLRSPSVDAYVLPSPLRIS